MRAIENGGLMSEDALIKQVFDEVRAANQRPMLHYTLSKEPVGLCDSKVGGVPYLPLGEEWPLDSCDDPLAFLAQIDCADLTPLPGFPHEGLLQFFIGTDIVMGTSDEEQRGFRVYYRESVDDAVTEEDVAARMPDVDPDIDYENYPLCDEDDSCDALYKMTFDAEATMQPITCADGRFDVIYARRWNELRPDLPLKGLYDACDYASDEDVVYDLIGVSDEAFDWNGSPDEQPGNQCGGYPSFTQDDCRAREDDSCEMDTLLFQLNTTVKERPDGKRDFFVCWGDAGVGNFLINGEALARRDFSRVEYYWDCY